MHLKDVLCQDRVIDRLQRAYAAGRMAHAYVFAGPEGVGRRTTAQAWARMLLCRHRQVSAGGQGRPFADSCGRCESCRLVDSGTHPDFRPIYKELRPYTAQDKGLEAKQDLPISVIREFLIDRAATGSTRSDYVVYVVHEAERLNNSSQNALLKVLEEPPGQVVVILLCSRLEHLLPTTLSRCQVLSFGAIDESILVQHLAEQGIPPEQGVFWARFCQGSLGQALRWAGLRVQDSSVYAIKAELVERLASLELAQVVDLAEWLLLQGRHIETAWLAACEGAGKTDTHRQSQKGLLRMIQSVLRDAMYLAAGFSEGLTHADQVRHVRRIAERLDAETLAQLVDKAAQNTRWIEASVNEKLIFEELLLQVALCGIMPSL